jgi:hypothetical protein
MLIWLMRYLSTNAIVFIEYIYRKSFIFDSANLDSNFAEGSRSNNTKTTYKNYSENQTRAKVAKYVSLHGKKISHATLAKAEKVYDAAQQEPATFSQIWTDLNSEKISPNGAYKKIQTHRNKIVEPQSSAASKQNEFKRDKKKKVLVSIRTDKIWWLYS